MYAPLTVIEQGIHFRLLTKQVIKMRVNLTIKNISMRHAQKICRYAEKQGITDDEGDIEIEELKSSLLTLQSEETENE